MTQHIREVLNRRTDLSTFVVHLTRNQEGLSAREALDSIITERMLRAGRPMGWADTQDDPSDESQQSQRVVCFTETPLEHIYSQASDIEGRQIQLRPYGVAMTKVVARSIGVNPIWYVDMSRGPGGSFRVWKLRNAIERLRDEAIRDGDFHKQPIAQITPFLEQMGTWPKPGGGYSRKEWWWEREWRHVGNLRLPLRGLIWLCPEEEMDSLAASGEPVIDPRWGLEQIIARLAGFTEEEVTPFLPDQASSEDWSEPEDDDDVF